MTKRPAPVKKNLQTKTESQQQYLTAHMSVHITGYNAVHDTEQNGSSLLFSRQPTIITAQMSYTVDGQMNGK